MLRRQNQVEDATRRGSLATNTRKQHVPRGIDADMATSENANLIVVSVMVLKLRPEVAAGKTGSWLRVREWPGEAVQLGARH